MSEPKVVEPGEGAAYVLMGSVHITFKRRGDPGEGCSIFEDACQAGYQGHPPHFHRDQDEIFYGLEGHFEFLVGDRTVECGPGSFVHLPKGTVHTFRNIGEEDGKLSVTISPACGFEELGEPTKEKSPPTPPPGPADAASAERLAALASEHGIEIVSPPSEQ